MTNPPFNPNDPSGQQPGGPFDQGQPPQNPYPQDPYQQAPYQQDPYQQAPYDQNQYPQNPYGAPVPAPEGGRPRPSVNMQQAVKLFFKNYAVFNGRASRSEYWWMFVFSWLISIILSGLGRMIGDSGTTFLDVLSGVWGLATIVPSLAIVWRRLHDTGRAGGWFFIVFVPIVGWIILIVFLASAPKADAWQRFDNGKLPVES
ncbi:MAG: DUF805 domain-containing protein [Acidipropionibacterium sp.]|jgi:uncharacterized membrane protein YhaH (DUF805 family)|nr:DUF805 domain-containing protein [Acidipropionibacterium sp.]